MSVKKQNKKNWVRFFNLDKWFLGFLYVLPLVLFFSYFPVISFGKSESMYFEISLPMIWLVLFDVLTFVMLVRRKKLLCDLKKWWMWLLFPVWILVSVVWSLNIVRGILTVGILWLVIFAVYGVWKFRELFDDRVRVNFLKWFFISSLVVCGWCILQCVLDLINVPRDYSLLCQGCTYKMFGFPHPNGFAVEPQFMGNLLLAPVIVSAYLFIKGQKSEDLKYKCLSPRFLLFCFLITSMTLFLTFSRGAIYALVIAMIFMSVMLVIKEKKRGAEIGKKIGVVWVMMVLAFGLTLNVQGVMAKVSGTNDTYKMGVTKVLNHLSLGIIDLRSDKSEKVVEKPVEKSVEKPVDNSVENNAVFDGYVAESTDIRMNLNKIGLEAWKKDLKTIVIGVGIGGAGQALYNDGLMPTAREIVQNEYVSILLETGVIGAILLILMVILTIKLVMKNKEVAPMILPLMVGYGVSLLFFSGFANALHIYLIPVVFLAMNYKVKRKKLVS